MENKQRIVAWFSCGAASAVAAKIAVDKYGRENVHLCRIHINSEHPDNNRFANEISHWLDLPIIDLRSDKYEDHFDVYAKTRFLVGPSGARCTTELKKVVRKNFQLPDDIQIFGMTADGRELKRAERLKKSNFDLNIEYPLIDANIKKKDCFRILLKAGIELPAMYRLGYENNNCIGCVKGGMGYWNKIRVDFPDTFDRMVAVEKDLKRTVLRKNGNPLPLAELPTDAGKKVDNSGCNFLCGGD